MEDWFPGRAGTVERDGLPIGLKAPLLDQVAANPTELFLVPDLGLPGSNRRVCPSLEFHVNVVAVNQWRLVVNEQISIAVRGRFLVIDEWIVDDVGKNVIKVLAGHVDRPRVFLIVAPLGPA